MIAQIRTPAFAKIATPTADSMGVDIGADEEVNRLVGVTLPETIGPKRPARGHQDRHRLQP